MNRATSIVLLVLAPVVSAQDAGDGCGSALDSFNRLKESFYANAESLDPKLAYSNLVTATRNCPEWGELWEFRAILGRQSGASKADIDHSLLKARELGWKHTDTSSGAASLTALPDQIGTKWALLVVQSVVLGSQIPISQPPAEVVPERSLSMFPKYL